LWPLELLRECERLLAVLRRRNGQIGGCRCGGQLLWERNAGEGLLLVAGLWTALMSKGSVKALWFGKTDGSAEKRN
jgi:hypothetical protein